jgi:N-alpha-acetyltransferase 15/16, NatA auxiliary subunit
LPDNISVERANTQYLQDHSTSPLAFVSVARASLCLESPREEIENVVFGILGPDVMLDARTALEALGILLEIGSDRAEEFRARAAERLPIATVFSTPEQQAELRKLAAAPAHADLDLDAEVLG